jgi:hypothetical protein
MLELPITNPQSSADGTLLGDYAEIEYAERLFDFPLIGPASADDARNAVQGPRWRLPRSEPATAPVFRPGGAVLAPKLPLRRARKGHRGVSLGRRGPSPQYLIMVMGESQSDG